MKNKKEILDKIEEIVRDWSYYITLEDGRRLSDKIHNDDRLHLTKEIKQLIEEDKQENCPECDGTGKYLQESYEGYKTEVNCHDCKEIPNNKIKVIE